ncbi:xanthine dehydrogenase molybdopterin binding subunit [Botrimarina hoheduenensis]|uniref:Xanthine dehydrogenase molybdenum-binding subunit n=1 Tax=Botrimarina hoheduenensis TaxID=2528000 RepID=A0A5C5WAG3_9BACT|nr:xanthine dehydrogenase molybdopterin binding subunit [Botrimarina hoheduenensis]TWT47497.1 Xanthine dehydrogenase molybdenum-binding subunit [Botrimarina hoheduenensis]
MPSSGKSLPHDSAHGHVTGGARYIDDLPRQAGELWVGFVGSPVASGKIRSLDLSEAREVPGVVCLLTHQDLGGPNHFGPIISDEPFLAEEALAYLTQPVVVIGATTLDALHAARQLVRIECEPLEPILTIDEALSAGSFIGPKRRMTSPGAEDDARFEAAFATAPHTLSGRFFSKGQEQFYFETQAALALPGEAGDVRVISSTQNPTETQAVVAEALGLGMHEVVCECHRMGGGFGGKETQSAIPAVMAAMVARHTGRPARVVLDRHDDMLVTGKRHAYQTDYRVAFDESGRLLAAQMAFYSNGGAFADLSTSVMERTMLHADNAYYVPLMRVTGQVCRTNLPPNTAFRGFGGPQGVAVIENCLEDIARVVGRDPIDVRRTNLYRDGDPQRSVTQYGQIVRDHVLAEIVAELEASSDYRRRREAIDRFNATSQTHCKGLALSTIKFGISFTTKFLNQANALVNLYTDGTVQVSTGGTEMGQGLNTKIRQLVADEFGLAPERVRVMPTTTEKNHNTSPTAASAGTDLNGAAALEACAQIKARMQSYAARLLENTERGLVAAAEHIVIDDGWVYDDRDPDPNNRIEFGLFCAMARRERVDLGARGFFATPGVDYNRDTGRGNPFFYFTTGAAVAEVTIDRFTGELVCDRADLLMDIGRSINPGVDRGQVIGGYIQGVGWVTNEDLCYDSAGRLLSTGPTTYKIPNITDTPRVFNVAFKDNPKHQKNLRQSKAVGEPPLMLGLAVWLAAKNALGSGSDAKVCDLAIPATGEELLNRIEALSSRKPVLIARS